MAMVNIRNGEVRLIHEDLTERQIGTVSAAKTDISWRHQRHTSRAFPIANVGGLFVLKKAIGRSEVRRENDDSMLK